MKNNIFSIFCIALAVFFLLPGLASANVQSTLYIQGPGGSVLVNTSLVVPDSCTVVDNVGVSHDFSGHRAPCAIQTAKDTGVIADFLFKDFGGLGLFLERVNGIASGPAPDYPYWNLWRNGVFSDVGINEIVLAQGDVFQLTYGPWITEIIRAPQVLGGAGPPPVHNTLNVKNAISFLLSLQNTDGSFGTAPLLSDWAALALSLYMSTETEHAKNVLRNYLLKDPPAGTLLTDYERRAMALMALGVNPYSGTPTNYIQKIVEGFDGEQFGDPGLINDDIFALLVLVKAGYQSFDVEIAKTITFLLGRQKSNGSFGSVDMTAAAIQVLALVSGAEGVSGSFADAKEYFQDQQENSGGFGNVYATSWAMQAIAMLGEFEFSWVRNQYTPGDYLYSQQAEDGGVEREAATSNRIWATSYAIPAALGESWGSILTQFEKSSLPQIETVAAPVTQETGVLETVEKEVVRISKEVAALKTEVLAFVTLARIEKELERIALETKAVQVRVVAFKVEQLAQNVGQTSPIAEASASQISSQDLSGITLSQEDETAPLAAEAREAVGAQGLSPQLIILLVIIGAAVFAFSGGMNTVLSYLRRTFSRV